MILKKCAYGSYLHDVKRGATPVETMATSGCMFR